MMLGTYALSGGLTITTLRWVYTAARGIVNLPPGMAKSPGRATDKVVATLSM
jgi:hypothetical protein